MGMTEGHGIAAIIIGTIQLILATGVIILSFVLSSYGLDIPSTPYWLGFPCFLPGLFGLAAGITKNKCFIITFLVLTIIMTVGSALASLFISLDWADKNDAFSAYKSGLCTTVGNSCNCAGITSYLEVKSCDFLGVMKGVMICLAFFCYSSAAVSLAGSILGCMATCCAPRDQPIVFAGPPGASPFTIASGPGDAHAQAYMRTHDITPLVV